MFAENHDSGTPTGLIGGLVALIGALSAYVLKLKAKVSRTTGGKVSVDEVIRNVVAQELKKAPWETGIRDVVKEAIAHEFRNSASFESVNRRLESLELRREEDIANIERSFTEVNRGLAAVRARLPAG